MAIAHFMPTCKIIFKKSTKPQIEDLKCAATFCQKSDAPSGKLNKHECITKARHQNTGFY